MALLHVIMTNTEPMYNSHLQIILYSHKSYLSYKIPKAHFFKDILNICSY